MEQRANDIRVRTTLSIFRLYPAWRQDNSADCKAWIEANKAHGKRLAADPEADIDEGWPDPATWVAVEPPKKTNIEKAIEQNGKEEPPESLKDLFQADRPYADQAQALWDKYNSLTNKIMLNVATDAERSKHAVLQGELDWIKRHVFEGV